MVMAILANFRIAGERSWLANLQKSVASLVEQTGREGVPDHLHRLDTVEHWQELQDYAVLLRKRVKRAEVAHLQRVATLVTLQQHATFQDQVFTDIGWTPPPIDDAPVEVSHECDICHQSFASSAALAVHLSHRHGTRIACRRFALDATCRVCARFYHTRARLLLHLQNSSTNCWVPHMRHFVPLSPERAGELDALDRDRYQAGHQRSSLSGT